MVGAILLIIGVITLFITSLLCCTKIDDRVIVCSFFLGLCFILFGGIGALCAKKSTYERTIKCETIERIDTLYVNDSIIGYKIIVK